MENFIFCTVIFVWARGNLRHNERFVNSLYDWNYTGIVKPEENEENDEENTDDENFVRASSNNNECDDENCFRLNVLLLLSFY